MLTPECSFSFRCVSINDRPPSATVCNELSKIKSPCHIFTFASQLTDGWSLSTRSAIDRPHPNTGLLSLDHGLQSVSTTTLYYGLQVCTIMVFICICNLARAQPPTVCPNSLNYGVQFRTITAFKFISKHFRLPPPSASPKLLNHDLGVHLYVHSITASKGISNDARLPPPSASLSLLDYGLQVCSIMASKCFSKLNQILLPSTSPNSLVHVLGVNLLVRSIIIFRRTSNFKQAPPAARPHIMCVAQ